MLRYAPLEKKINLTLQWQKYFRLFFKCQHFFVLEPSTTYAVSNDRKIFEIEPIVTKMCKSNRYRSFARFARSAPIKLSLSVRISDRGNFSHFFTSQFNDVAMYILYWNFTPNVFTQTCLFTTNVFIHILNLWWALFRNVFEFAYTAYITMTHDILIHQNA